MPTGLNRLNLTPLRSACRKFHWQHALHLLDGLWAVGHRPGAVPCSEVLRSMARRRRWQPALALLAELRERRLKLDTVCFNIGMHACEQHWEPGRTWLVTLSGRPKAQDMKRPRGLSPPQTSPRNQQFGPESEADATKTSFLRALESYQLSASQWFRVCVLGVFLGDCDIEEHALQLFADLNNASLPPSVVSYGALFVSLGQGHRWAQVLQLLKPSPQLEA
ncbi:unnamed protein product, partial [Durusdinium trenchii]